MPHGMYWVGECHGKYTLYQIVMFQCLYENQMIKYKMFGDKVQCWLNGVVSGAGCKLGFKTFVPLKYHTEIQQILNLVKLFN